MLKRIVPLVLALVLCAGLAQAKGDSAVVLDCDLQHQPEKIVEMYRLWQQGYQVEEGYWL